jgi:AraC-like DNA-binding protein
LEASNKLTSLDLKVEFNNVDIIVQWFRVMKNSGSWHIGRHVHSYIELHLIKEGSCRVVLDNGELIVQKDEFYISSPGVYHEQFGNNDGEFLEYCLCFDTEIKSGEDTEGSLLAKLINDSPCVSAQDAYGAIAAFDSALKEAFNMELGYYNKIKSLTSLIILSAARTINCGKILDYRVPLKEVNVDLRFNMIKKYVEDNILSAITPRELSTHMHLSERQILRIIKQKLGMSTKEYINIKRLEKAKELIGNTNMSIKELAEIMGFSSEYYFSQFFKRTSGYPPTFLRHGSSKPVNKH